MDQSQMEDARVGYPCLYPNCTERRKYPIQLVEHVERDHTSREVLERMVIRDKLGNILALPPHCIYRYFPDVGLSPDKVHEIMDSITAKDRNNDPLFSSANVPPSPHYTQQHHQNSLPLASAPSTYPQVHLGDMGAYSNSGGPSHSGFMPNSSNGHVAGPLSVQTRAVTAAASSSSNLSLNELLASPNGNPATQDEKLMQLLALRQRVIQQQQQQQQTQSENQEPNIVVAGLRQLLAAPHTPLLQQLVQTTKVEKHPALRNSSSSLPSAAGGGGGRSAECVNPLPCTSPSPSTHASSTASSCATPPAPSPDSGRGSESSTEESIDQSMSVASVASTGSSALSFPDENSNDSWMQREDYSIDAIVTYSRSGVGKRPRTGEADKPYACPVPGCQKAYKNMNGIKYHARCAHRVRKPHRCGCNKKYSSEEKYLAHLVKCPSGGVSGTIVAPRKGSSIAAASSTPPPSTPAQASISSSASVTTTPTLHQLLSRSTSNTATTTAPNPATKAGHTLPSLPSVFSPGGTLFGSA